MIDGWATLEVNGPELAIVLVGAAVALYVLLIVWRDGRS